MTIKEKLANGFQKIEELRLSVKYVMVHPDDLLTLNQLFDENLSTMWGAKVIVTDVHQPGIVLAASMLLEPEPPLNTHQITSVIDIS
jgi:hypothetical protein